MEVLVSQEALDATIALRIFRVWLVGLVGKGWEVDAERLGKESVGTVGIDPGASRLAISDCQGLMNLCKKWQDEDLLLSVIDLQVKELAIGMLQ